MITNDDDEVVITHQIPGYKNLTDCTTLMCSNRKKPLETIIIDSEESDSEDVFIVSVDICEKNAESILPNCFNNAKSLDAFSIFSTEETNNFQPHSPNCYPILDIDFDMFAKYAECNDDTSAQNNLVSLNTPTVDISNSIDSNNLSLHPQYNSFDIKHSQAFGSSLDCLKDLSSNSAYQSIKSNVICSSNEEKHEINKSSYEQINIGASLVNPIDFNEEHLDSSQNQFNDIQIVQILDKTIISQVQKTEMLKNDMNPNSSTVKQMDETDTFQLFKKNNQIKMNTSENHLPFNNTPIINQANVYDVDLCDKNSQLDVIDKNLYPDQSIFITSVHSNNNNTSNNFLDFCNVPLVNLDGLKTKRKAANNNLNKNDAATDISLFKDFNKFSDKSILNKNDESSIVPILHIKKKRLISDKNDTVIVPLSVSSLWSYATCYSCKKSLLKKDLSFCISRHGCCGSCLETQVKLLLACRKKGTLKCKFEKCDSYYLVSQLKNSLPAMVVEILEDKLDREYVENASILIMPIEDNKTNNNKNYEVSDNEWIEEVYSKQSEPEKNTDVRIELPSKWLHMANDMEYCLVDVPAVSLDYENVSNLFHKTMKRKRTSITRIRRLQNPVLWQFYSVKKLQMEKNSQTYETDLFHGTRSDLVDAICRSNFDWRMCGAHGTVYGQGSYFARDASYSHMYTDNPGKPTTPMRVFKKSILQQVANQALYKPLYLNQTSITNQLTNNGGTSSIGQMNGFNGQVKSLSGVNGQVNGPIGLNNLVNGSLGANAHANGQMCPLNGSTDSQYVPPNTNSSSNSSMLNSCRYDPCSNYFSKFPVPQKPMGLYQYITSICPPTAHSSNCTNLFQSSLKLSLICSPPQLTNSKDVNNIINDASSMQNSSAFNCLMCSQSNGVSQQGGMSQQMVIPPPSDITGTPQLNIVPNSLAINGPVNKLNLNANIPNNSPKIYDFSMHKNNTSSISNNNLTLPVAQNMASIAPLNSVPNMPFTQNIISNEPIQEETRTSHTMFLAKVLIGKCTLGRNSYRKPPPLDINDPYGACYDSCVNDVNNPSIYVIFNSAQSYPEYIIEYSCSLKE